MHTRIESLESRMMLAAATVGVYTTDNTASESNPSTTGKGVFVVKRLTGGTSKALVVNLGLRSASTATTVADFVALPTSVTIPNGKTSVNVNLIPVNDTSIEGSEKVVWGVKTGNYTIVHDKATVTIADNDLPSVGIYATDNTASETDPSGVGKGVFTFNRTTGPTTSKLVLTYRLRVTSTAETDDFNVLSGTITIPAGQRTKTLNIIPVDDDTDETNETVTLVLENGNFQNIHDKATVTIADNDDPADQDWLGGDRRFRTAISVDVGDFARSNQPIDTHINFTGILGGFGAGGALNDDSIIVVEVGADGSTEIDANVPYQFDHDSDFDASTNATGNLVIITKGSTDADATRHYHVYFDVDGAGSYSAPSFTAQVTTTENDSDEGLDAVKVQNQTATYWLQKQNGGFSSIEDNDGNDWLSFDPTGGSNAGGEYRGTPNAAFPGGGFHAGFNTGSTEIIHVGPLKTTVESTVTADHGTYTMRYEFYGSFVRASMLSATGVYWFLYEGTPGGSIDGNDTYFRSDSNGTGISVDTAWTENGGLGSSSGEEWVYFRDSAVDKYIYFAHNTADNLKDMYYRDDDVGSMTMLGFGRDDQAADIDHHSLLTDQNSFTFGIGDGGDDFDAAATTIKGQYKVLNGALGTSESNI